MTNEINEVIARRTNSYNRAVIKTEKVLREVEAYEKANDGFLSSFLLNKLDKVQTAQSKAYAAMVRAEAAA